MYKRLMYIKAYAVSQPLLNSCPFTLACSILQHSLSDFTKIFLAARVQMDENRDDILRHVCDKRTYDAMEMLSGINREKGKAIKEKVLSYFKLHKRPIAYADYKQIISSLREETTLCIQRRANLYDLDDIGDDL